MNKKLYAHAKIATRWYNFTEGLAYVALHRPTPKTCEYSKISYGSGRKQYINLCTRKDLRCVKKPLFIYIHGGGWISGITEMRDTYVANWAEKGFFTASISYTYAPEKVFPEQLKEIFAAIDLLFDKADEYNYDTGKVVLAGESAGGYYILECAALAKDKTLFDTLGIDFRHRNEFDVRALVSHCGCFDLKNLLDKSKPQSKFFDMQLMACSFLGMDPDEAIAFLETPEGSLSYPHITEAFPPAFIISASKDWLRFEAYDLAKQYEAAGLKYETFEGTGIISQHAWTIATIVEKGRECFLKSYEFVMEVLENQ
jgi:acetyl esterase/lipase